MLRNEPLCLMLVQHAQVNYLYELSLVKSNHISIDGCNPDEITEIINAMLYRLFHYDDVCSAY